MGLLDDAERNLDDATTAAEATRQWLTDRGGNLWLVQPDLLRPDVQQVARDLFARTPGDACYLGAAPDGRWYATTTPLRSRPAGMTPARRLTMYASTPGSDD